MAKAFFRPRASSGLVTPAAHGERAKEEAHAKGDPRELVGMPANSQVG